MRKHIGLTDAQRVALGSYMARWLPGGMMLRPEDWGTIRCQCGLTGAQCPHMARYVEHRRWGLSTEPRSTGIAFDYYCEACWIAPGPLGRSPRDRATERHP